jgi:COMPASS component SWD3
LSSNHHNNRIFSIKCLKEDRNIFFSGGWDSTIQVWDVRMKEESVRKICGPTISADSLDFKNGQILAGNYQNKDILQLWDFKSGELIETLDIN